MKFLNNLRIALFSVRKRFFRNLMSVMGIIVGTLSVLLVLGIGNGLSKTVSQLFFQGFEGDKLIIEYVPNGTAGSFQKSDLQLIRQLPNVKKVTLPSYDTLSKNAVWQGQSKSLELETISSGANARKTNIIELNKALLKDTNFSNIHIGDYLFIQGRPFKVTKLYSKPIPFIGGQPSGGRIGKLDYQLLKGRHSNNYDEMDVTLQKNLSAKQEQHTKAQILQTLERKGFYHNLGDYDCPDTSVAKKQMDKIIRMLATFISIVAGISLVTAGMGIMNTMTANIAERTQEIGLRRSIGASKHDITLQFLLEGTLLTFSGGIISLLLALIIQIVVNSMHISHFMIYIKIINILIVLIIVLIIGVIFSYFPARRASRKNIVNLIR